MSEYEVGVGLGFGEVEVDEVVAVDEGAEGLGGGAEAEEGCYREAGEDVGDYLSWKIRHGLKMK